MSALCLRVLLACCVLRAATGDVDGSGCDYVVYFKARLGQAERVLQGGGFTSASVSERRTVLELLRQTSPWGMRRSGYVRAVDVRRAVAAVTGGDDAVDDDGDGDVAETESWMGCGTAGARGSLSLALHRAGGPAGSGASVVVSTSGRAGSAAASALRFGAVSAAGVVQATTAGKTAAEAVVRSSVALTLRVSRRGASTVGRRRGGGGGGGLSSLLGYGGGVEGEEEDEGEDEEGHEAGEVLVLTGLLVKRLPSPQAASRQQVVVDDGADAEPEPAAAVESKQRKPKQKQKKGKGVDEGVSRQKQATAASSTGKGKQNYRAVVYLAQSGGAAALAAASGTLYRRLSRLRDTEELSPAGERLSEVLWRPAMPLFAVSAAVGLDLVLLLGLNVSLLEGVLRSGAAFLLVYLAYSLDKGKEFTPAYLSILAGFLIWVGNPKR